MRRVERAVHGEAWRTQRIPESLAKAGAWLQHRMEDVVPDFIDRGIEPFIQPFMIPLADDHYELDISRARKLLGWEPRRSLRETLPVMIARLKRAPNSLSHASLFLGRRAPFARFFFVLLATCIFSARRD